MLRAFNFTHRSRPTADYLFQNWLLKSALRQPLHRIAPLEKAASVACLGSLIILLQGCASTQTAQVVKIQVPIPCVTQDQLPVAPNAKTDAELKAMNDADLIVNLAADRLEYRRYSTEAQAILISCTK